MFGAGEGVKLTKELLSIIDIAGGEDYFCPDNDTCSQKLKGAAQAPVDKYVMSDPTQQAFYGSAGVAAAAMSVKSECLVKYKNDPDSAKTCYENAFAGIKRSEIDKDKISGASIFWFLDGNSISVPEYLDRIAGLIKAGQKEVVQTAADVVVLAPVFKSFLESIKDNPELYAACLRLFYQGAAQAGAAKMNSDQRAKALDGIGTDVQGWGEIQKARLAKPETADKAKESIRGAYVDNVAPKDDTFKASIKDAPVSLFDAEALGYPKGTKLPSDAELQMLLLFYRGLMSSRAQGQNVGPDVIAKTIVKGVASRVKDKEIPIGELADDLAAILNNVTLANKKAGKAEELPVAARFDDMGGKVPGKLFLAMKLDPDNLDPKNDLVIALRAFWNDEIEGNKDYKALKDDQKKAIRGKIVDSLIPIFNAYGAEKPRGIALTMVKSIGADGKVETELPDPKLMERHKDRRDSLSFCLQAKRLYKAALADEIGKTKKKEVVADQVSERIEYALVYDNAEKIKHLDLNKFSKESLKYGDTNKLRSAFEDEAHINGFDKETGELRPITIGHPGMVNILVPETYSFLAKASAGTTDKPQAFGGFEIEGSYRGYDDEGRWHYDVSGSGGGTSSPLLNGDPSKTLAYKKQSASYDFGINSLLAGGGLTLKDDDMEHDISAMVGIVPGTIDPSLSGMLAYTFSSAGQGEAGSFQLGGSLDFGRILNSYSFITAEDLEQFEFGAIQLSAALALNKLMLHEESKTGLKGKVGYRHTFSEENPSAVFGNFSLFSKPKSGDHKFPLELGIKGWQKFNKNDDYSATLFLKAGFETPITDSWDFFMNGGLSYTFNSPYVMQTEEVEGFTESIKQKVKVPSCGDMLAFQALFGIKNDYFAFETGPQFSKFFPVKDSPKLNFGWIFSVSGFINP
ncbi:MAG TPA: hypothetical protein PLY45_00430 [bacterium]|nr:hypothetical protein [bacterium]